MRKIHNTHDYFIGNILKLSALNDITFDAIWRENQDFVMII